MAGGYLSAAAGVRRFEQGKVLIGGSPPTILRLSPAGSAALDHWLRGVRPDWNKPSHRRLASRLVETGICVESPSRNEAANSATATVKRTPNNTASNSRLLAEKVTVVIPVRDDHEGLAATIRSLSSITVPLIVVDDGSFVPVNRALVPDHGQLLRNEESTGPGSARQRAMDHVTSPLVAFIDAGVLLSAADLAELASYLDLDHSAAAAPRVRSLPEDHLTARYDHWRSPLDMGSNAGTVGLQSSIPYVPTACLLVRTSSLMSVKGFDSSLRYGEDVDLVWRLGAHGLVHYVPSIEVFHPARRSLVALAKQRFNYGSAAAPLAKRHQQRVAPLQLSKSDALTKILVLTGRPIAAAAVFTAGVGLLARKLPDIEQRSVHASRLSFQGHWNGWMSVLTALCRTWWPVAVLIALLVPQKRRSIVTALAIGFTRRLTDGPPQPDEALVDVSVGVLDDVAYGLGVWLGALRHRTIIPLLPAKYRARPATRR